MKRQLKRQLKRPKILLGLLVTLALVASIFGTTVPVMAATPPGANSNNVVMSLGGIPTEQTAGGSIDYYIVVKNDQSSPSPPWYSADAQDITVTFYPAQADGTPSATGTVVGTIAYLAVDATPVTIGPVTYAMPALNPGVTTAVSRAVLQGTILLGAAPAGLPFSIVKEVSIALQETYQICGFKSLAGTTTGLAGWEIILQKWVGDAWVEEDRATTDTSGKYCFEGLEAGEYRVSEMPKQGWTQVSPIPNEHLVPLPDGASDPEAGPFYDFENELPAVGGTAYPVSRLAILAPWIALALVIFAGANLLLRRHRRA